MKVKQAIKNMEEKKLDLMKENFQEALTQKAVERLEEMKFDISQKFLGIK